MDDAAKQKAERNMFRGAAWCLGGILVTAVTYLLARASRGGGVYVIAWGAILFGGIRFAIGMVQMSRLRAAEPRTAHGRSSQRYFGGMVFTPPPGWSVEDAQGGLLILARQPEAGWQANLFLEAGAETALRSLEQSLDDYVANLAARRRQFREVGRMIVNHPYGFRFARVEYTCVDDAVALTQWELIIELDGDQRLFVLASSASALWDKYRPAFQGVVDSLRRDQAAALPAPRGEAVSVLQR
ncbi:MAG: hypothetical protein K8S99_14145 [Planctomycetes bacterium]|nr:hypothetical protein [Planctomycetota bacterium]